MLHVFEITEKFSTKTISLINLIYSAIGTLVVLTAAVSSAIGSCQFQFIDPKTLAIITKCVPSAQAGSAFAFVTAAFFAGCTFLAFKAFKTGQTIDLRNRI